jgi:hypothetical protein
LRALDQGSRALDRIASALDRIASALDRKGAITAAMATGSHWNRGLLEIGLVNRRDCRTLTHHERRLADTIDPSKDEKGIKPP